MEMDLMSLSSSIQEFLVAPGDPGGREVESANSMEAVAGTSHRLMEGGEHREGMSGQGEDASISSGGSVGSVSLASGSEAASRQPWVPGSAQRRIDNLQQVLAPACMHACACAIHILVTRCTQPTFGIAA